MPIKKESLLINLHTRNDIPFNFHVTLKLYKEFSIQTLSHSFRHGNLFKGYSLSFTEFINCAAIHFLGLFLDDFMKKIITSQVTKSCLLLPVYKTLEYFQVFYLSMCSTYSKIYFRILNAANGIINAQKFSVLFFIARQEGEKKRPQ